MNDQGVALFDKTGKLISESSEFRRMTRLWLDYETHELQISYIYQNSHIQFDSPDNQTTILIDASPVLKIRYSAIKLPNHQVCVSCENYTFLNREKEVQSGRAKILRLAAEGTSLSSIMQKLVLAAESVNPGVTCSLLMVDRESGRLEECAAPNLPKVWREMVDGMRIGAEIGSCGHAAHTGEDVFAEDIYLHPYWQRVVELSKQVGLRSCWSTPVLDNQKNIVATFAMYTKEVNVPDKWEISFMHSTAQLAGIIIQQRRTEERAIEIAELDDLTGLMNRKRFILTLSKELQNYELNPVYLCFLDLNQFKTVNDTLGHIIGDKLLQETTVRINKALNEHTTLGRIGGDEFAFFLSGNQSKASVEAQAKKVIAAITKPFSINDNDIHIGANIGIAVAPEHANSPEQLISAADIALHESKFKGRHHYQFYDNSMLAEIQREELVRNRLEYAIKNKLGISLVFQPQINAVTTQIMGCEALCRWDDEEIGSVSPNEFIHVAEKKGLMTKLSDIIVDQALAQIILWKDQFNFLMPMAINFAASQFQDQSTITKFLDKIKTYNIDTCLLECEITESTLIGDFQLALETMRRLNEAGIGIAIDDFGTGYSSLSYIKQLPIQKLKIDRSFIKELTNDKRCEQITSAIVSLGCNLGIKVVAEGVEDEEQAKTLTKYKCDYFQGFLFSRPLTGKQFAEYYLMQGNKSGVAQA